MAWQANKMVMRWKDFAAKWSAQTGVPVGLILAVIQQESGGNPEARRQEPGYCRKFCESYKFKCIKRATGLADIDIATSYGLMQLMVPTAWGYLSEVDKGPNVVAVMCNPNLSVRYGAAHLAAIAKGLDVPLDDLSDAAIRSIAARYNGCQPHDAYAKNVAALCRRYE